MATLEINRGTDFYKKYVWTAAGVPVDLTGASAKAQIRAEPGAETVLLELSSAAGTIQLGGATGTIEYKLGNAVTADIEFDTGVIDCVITFSDSTKKRRLFRKVKVTGGVTQ